MKVKAAVCNEYKTPLSIEEIDLREPAAEEVLIKLVSTGVCHTDIVAQDNGWDGWNPLPMVFGHEGAGIVEKVGPGVLDFQVGDHVVISYPNCGICNTCITGREWFCLETERLTHHGKMRDGGTTFSRDGQPVGAFFGTGTFSSHLVSSVRNLAKIDKDVDLAHMAPLACGFMTGSGAVLNQLQPKIGDTIAIYGAGGVGFASMFAANISHCSKVIMVDVVESRLKLAKELGATHVINANEVDDVTAEIRKITDGKGVNFAAETTGAEQVVLGAIDALALDGEIAIIAVPRHVEFKQFFYSMFMKKVTTIIMGCAHTKLFIPQIIEYYKQGLFPFDRLVKFYDFKDINKAMDDSHEGTTIKPIVKY